MGSAVLLTSVTLFLAAALVWAAPTAELSELEEIKHIIEAVNEKEKLQSADKTEEDQDHKSEKAALVKDLKKLEKAVEEIEKDVTDDNVHETSQPDKTEPDGSSKAVAGDSDQGQEGELLDIVDAIEKAKHQHEQAGTAEVKGPESEHKHKDAPISTVSEDTVKKLVKAVEDIEKARAKHQHQQAGTAEVKGSESEHKQEDAPTSTVSEDAVKELVKAVEDVEKDTENEKQEPPTNTVSEVAVAELVKAVENIEKAKQQHHKTENVEKKPESDAENERQPANTVSKAAVEELVKAVEDIEKAKHQHQPAKSVEEKKPDADNENEKQETPTNTVSETAVAELINAVEDIEEAKHRHQHPETIEEKKPDSQNGKQDLPANSVSKAAVEKLVKAVEHVEQELSVPHQAGSKKPANEPAKNPDSSKIGKADADGPADSSVPASSGVQSASATADKADSSHVNSNGESATPELDKLVKIIEAVEDNKETVLPEIIASENTDNDTSSDISETAEQDEKENHKEKEKQDQISQEADTPTNEGNPAEDLKEEIAELVHTIQEEAHLLPGLTDDEISDALCAKSMTTTGRSMLMRKGSIQLKGVSANQCKTGCKQWGCTSYTYSEGEKVCFVNVPAGGVTGDQRSESHPPSVDKKEPTMVLSRVLQSLGECDLWCKELRECVSFSFNSTSQQCDVSNKPPYFDWEGASDDVNVTTVHRTVTKCDEPLLPADASDAGSQCSRRESRTYVGIRVESETGTVSANNMTHCWSLCLQKGDECLALAFDGTVNKCHLYAHGSGENKLVRDEHFQYTEFSNRACPKPASPIKEITFRELKTLVRRLMSSKTA